MGYCFCTERPRYLRRLPDSRSYGCRTRSWYGGYYPVLIILIGTALLYFVVHISSWESPSPRRVWEFFKDYWLWIVLVLVGPFWALGYFANPWAKAAKGIIGAIAVMLVGALIVHGVWGESSPENVLTLTAPANGKSPPIDSGKNGSFVTFSGKDYIGHCIYNDGRDEAYPCSTGDGLIKLYVQDTSGKENTVTYTRS